MSCCAMYQPYAPYFPYQRTDYARHPPPPPPPLSAAKSLSAKSAEEEEGGLGKGGRAQYLSANCVLLTYFSSGDAAAEVDEHFARALSTCYKAPAAAAATAPAPATKGEGPPMSHRNFPASFWNQQAAAAEAAVYGAAAEPYGYGPPPHQDPWSPWAAAAAAYPQPRYQYAGPLHLLQRPSRLPAAAAACAAAAQDAWSDAYYPPPPGLDGQPHQESKDLYWF